MTDRDQEVFVAAYQMALRDAAQCAEGVVKSLTPKSGSIVSAEEAYRGIESTMNRFATHLKENAPLLAQLNLVDYVHGRRGGDMPPGAF